MSRERGGQCVHLEVLRVGALEEAPGLKLRQGDGAAVSHDVATGNEPGERPGALGPLVTEIHPTRVGSRAEVGFQKVRIEVAIDRGNHPPEH